MKPIILILFSSIAFRSCDFLIPAPPLAAPIMCEFTITNDAGLPSHVFASGESFILSCRVSNRTGSDRLYTHTGPALYFELWQGEKLVVSSTTGTAWAQVVLTDTLYEGQTDTHRWRAPWTPAEPLPTILPAGLYRAHVVSQYMFLDGTTLHAADLPVTILEKPVPEWVKQLVTLFESQPPGNPQQSIWEYTYLDSTVYYVPPQCCDQFSVLYDRNGVVLGAPDGGIAGHGDGRCADFLARRTNERLVWKDMRGKQ